MPRNIRNRSSCESIKVEIYVLIQSFYRAANAVFGKIGRMASEEVTLQLIKSKCLPELLYGLEACPLTKTDLQSRDFVSLTDVL